MRTIERSSVKWMNWLPVWFSQRAGLLYCSVGLLPVSSPHARAGVDWLVSRQWQRQVWLIPIADERVGVQVKLWNPLRTRAIPEHFCGGDSLYEEALYQVYMHLYLFDLAFSSSARKLGMFYCIVMRRQQNAAVCSVLDYLQMDVYLYVRKKCPIRRNSGTRT